MDGCVTCTQTNFGKTNRFAMIKAEGDTMVYPNEGEWWGHFDDDSFDSVLPMNETDWYAISQFVTCHLSICHMLSLLDSHYIACVSHMVLRYKQDLFGLKTADENGKIVFNSTTGDHLQFTSAQLLAWVDAYF